MLSILNLCIPFLNSRFPVVRGLGHAGKRKSLVETKEENGEVTLLVIYRLRTASHSSPSQPAF